MLRQFQATPQSNPDPGAQALLSLFADPVFLLQSLWDVNGTAALVEDGANTGAKLTETADTYIGQEITPTGDHETLSVNLSSIIAGSGDELEVLFNDKIIGGMPLQGTTAGTYSLPMYGLGTQPGELKLKLTGPTNAGAVVTLESLSVVPAPNLLSTKLGDGTALIGTQRSEVRDIQLSFDHAVTLFYGAVGLSLVNSSGASAALGTPTSSDGGVTWTIPVLARTNFSDKTGSLNDGLYVLTIYSNDVVDSAGNSLNGGDQSVTFHRLLGDMNGDGKVGFSDLVILASNYGHPGTAAGGDLNADGRIDFRDLVLLAANYGKTLAAPAAPADVSSPSIASDLLHRVKTRRHR